MKSRMRGPRVSDRQIIAAVEGMWDGLTLMECCDLAGLQYRNTKRRIRESAELRSLYAEAREAYAHAVFDRIVDVAKTESDVKRARLLIDTYKWQAAKVIPKIYGDKITQEHIGSGGGPVAFANMSDDQLDDHIRSLMRQVATNSPEFFQSLIEDLASS